MPFLGFVGRRPSSPSKDSIKDHFRNVTSKGSSTLSLKSAKFEDRSAMDALKRHGIGSKLLPERRSSHSGPKTEPHKFAKLDMLIESPPLVSYNTPANSSGALFSAQLQLDVIDPDVVIESLDLQLFCSVTVKKPVHQHCPECTTKTTELRKWSFAKEPLRLQKGKHPFPFSYLFPGHLPATTHSSLVMLDYYVAATAKKSSAEHVSYHKTINLVRSVMPGNDKHSIRVFPPTNLTASVTLNPSIHPIGDFPVSLRLSGITSKKNESEVRWRLRKLTWRIDEHEKMISPACPKHAQKLGGEGKGILHEDVRQIGEGEVSYSKNPWKSDFGAGEVDAEFNCVINPAKKPVCDAEAPNGLSISHNLIIEMVVSEEWIPKNKPKQVTPTGAARILRTQFHLMVTERPGLGVSWDEETPPVYEDVPESPPHYTQMTDFDLSEIGGQVEEFQLDPNTSQLLTAAASSSGTARPSSAASTSSAGSEPAPAYPGMPTSARGRYVLNVEDLLSAPPEHSQSGAEGEGEDEDVEVVRAENAR